MANKNPDSLFKVEGIGSYNTDVEQVITFAGADGKATSDGKTDLILTDFAGSNSVVYQLQYALDNTAYAVVFGDRLSVFTVRGVGLPKTPCVDASPKVFIDCYKKYKLTTVKPQALQMGAGGMVMTGFFISLDIALARAEQPVFTFVFKFLGVLQS